MFSLLSDRTNETNLQRSLVQGTTQGHSKVFWFSSNITLRHWYKPVRINERALSVTSLRRLSSVPSQRAADRGRHTSAPARAPPHKTLPRWWRTAPVAFSKRVLASSPLWEACWGGETQTRAHETSCIHKRGHQASGIDQRNDTGGEIRVTSSFTAGQIIC